ncbi:MAG: UDP-N-acetylmuramoyl-L-alanine--D-glutamate ligase, partial [Gammaproteobacteria bacterium]|nr:UDP-N-acetylmuramoyl-L-alanine--D-glutamate ligase [Gammaproteobacteria bacterium]
ARGKELLMEERGLGIRGRFNTANALAALAVGEAMGLTISPMLDTLHRYCGLEHRCQWVAAHAGVDWYNDSKGTNVGASLAAIRGLECKGKLILIAGGEGKGADFSPLRTVVQERVRSMVLIGRDGPLIAQAIGGEVPALFASTMEDAVCQARDLAHPGDAVLLSPACASFDMFSDYQVRGEIFMAAVRGDVSS